MICVISPCKAAERGLAVRLLVKDATTLGDWCERFASVIDCTSNERMAAGLNCRRSIATRTRPARSCTR
jgi:hypothetical protein